MTSPIILQPHQIIKLEERFTQKEIADIFKVNVKTIQRWKYPSNLPKQKRGRKFLFDQNELYILSCYITTFKVIAQKKLANDFSRWMKKSISQPTICRALKRAVLLIRKFLTKP